MRIVLSLAFAMVLAVAGIAADTLPATGGNVEITPVFHAHTQLEFGGRVIQVDPYSQGDLSKAKPADLILVTHAHGDHLDPVAIEKLRKAGTTVIMPAASKEAAAGKVAEPILIMANGETKTVNGITVEAVAMYNLPGPGQTPADVRHVKGVGNGYVVTLGGKRLYFGGDTQCAPEIKALKNIDVAFLPGNVPQTMPPSEAAECAKAFQPKIAYIYHFRGQKPEDFTAALAGQPIDARIRDWYVAPPAAAK